MDARLDKLGAGAVALAEELPPSLPGILVSNICLTEAIPLAVTAAAVAIAAAIPQPSVSLVIPVNAPTAPAIVLITASLTCIPF